MIFPISYPITIKTPLYPKTPPVSIRPLRSISLGDSANTSTVTFSTHTGTHIDAPRHFCRQGKTIAEVLMAAETFFPAYCIDLQKQSSEEICANDFVGSIEEIQNAEALLIRTGWHEIRSKDPDRYCQDNPWLSPDVPVFLRKHCPGLRLFGLDQISVSSVHQREKGLACHQEFLCRERSILILEDVNLSICQSHGSFKLHIYPYFVEEVDGVPVIAIVEI